MADNKKKRSPGYEAAVRLLDGLTATGTAVEDRTTTTTTTSGGSKQSADEYVNQRMNQLGLNKDKPTVDDDYINTFISDSNSFLDSYKSDYQKMSYGTATSLYKSRKAAADDLTKRRWAISEYLEENKELFSEEEYNSFKKYLEDVGVSVSEATQGIYYRYRPYSQFATEEEYDTAVRMDGYRQKYQGKGYDEIQSILDGLDDGEEKDWLTEYGKSDEVMTSDVYARLIGEKQTELDALSKWKYNYDATWRDPDSLADEDYSQKSQLIKTLEEELEQLQAGKWRLDNESKYGSLSENEEYRKLSRNVQDEPTATFGALIGGKWVGKGDLTYDYINDIGETRAQIDRPHGGDVHLQKYSLMTRDEIANYNYLYNTDGKDAANQYLKYLEYDLDARRQQQVTADNAEFATDHPVLSSIYSVPANLMSGVGLLDAAWQNAVKGYTEATTGEYAGPINYNSVAMTPNTISTAIRGTVAQNITDSTGIIDIDTEEHPVLSKLLNGKSMGDVYQLGMSITDSATVAALSPIIGTAGTALLGGSAGTQGMLDAIQNGATDEQALTMGILNGAFEILFEKYELEHLLGADTNFLKSLANQALSEAVGEGSTSIANFVANTLVMAENSDLSTAIAAYMEQGLSKDKAFRQALLDTGIEIVWDAAGGLLSGGVMGGGTALFHKGADALSLNAASQDIATIQNAAASRLTELGETENVEAVAAALAKQAAGGRLSGSEQKAISASQYGQRVANELDAENIRSGGYSSAWAEQIGTEKVNADVYGRAVQTSEDAQDSTETAGEQIDVSVQNEAQTVAGGRTELETASEKYGAQAKAMIRTYTAGQDVAKYDQAYQVAYDMGKSGVALDYVMNSGAVSYLSEGQRELAYEAGVAAAKSDRITVSDTGKTAQVKEIAAIRNGEMMLLLDDGDTVNSKNVEYASDSQALIYDSVMGLGMDAAAANTVIRAYNDGSGISAEVFVGGVEQAYTYGKYNYDQRELAEKGSPAYNLTAAQRSEIYKLGQAAGGRQVAKEQATARRNRKVDKDDIRTGVVHYSADAAKAIEAGVKDTQHAGVQAAEIVSKLTGVDVYIFESYERDGLRYFVDENGVEQEAANGWYNRADGSIHIDLHAGNLDAKTGNTRGTVLFTLSHELTHFIKQWSPAKFKSLANFLVHEYGERNVSVDALVHRKMDKLKLDYDAAFEEVVADSMETMLTSGNAIETLAEIKRQDKTLWQKIVDFLKNFAAKLRKIVDAYAGVSADTIEGRYVADMQDVIREIEQLYAEALYEASENYQAAEAQKNTTAEGGVKMQTRSVDGNPLVWIDDSGFTSAQLKDPKAIAQYIANHIGEVYRIIESGQKVYIGKDLPGEYTHSKYTSYLQKKKPAILKAKNKASASLGEMIEIATNRRWEATKHKASKDAKYGMYRYDTKFAFPIKDQNGRVTSVKAFDAELLIRNASDGKKYLYDIVNITEDTASALDLRHKEARKGSYEAATQSDVSKHNVAQEKSGVKPEIYHENSDSGIRYSNRDSNGNQLSEEQQEFFKDSKVRDEQGRLLVMYHGTPNGSHTTFRSGTYFTQNRAYADVYQNPGASSISVKNDASNPRTYEVYLNIKKPFDTRNPKEHQIFMQEFYRQWGTGTPLADSGLPDWVDGMDLQEFIEEMEYDYDGLILDEGGVGGYGDEVVSRGLSYVTFSSNQAKNVDNLTPTSDPDIRYSKRDFSEQVDSVLGGTFDRTNAVYVGETPAILKEVGLNGNLPMLTTAHHIKNAVKPKNTKRHQHGLTEAQVKSIPDKIADPVMVLDSRNAASNSVVVITDMLDPDRAPVIVTIMADGTGMFNNIEVNTNFVTSYYGRDGFASFIKNNVIDDNFLFINEKKATVLETESSTQWLEQLKNYDFDTIIRKTRANVKRQERSTDSVSNRSLLANALAGAAQNEIEQRRVQEYQDKIGLMDAEERKLNDLNRQIRELSFGKGPRDKEQIAALQLEARQTANRINTYDRQLLRLEASKPLQNVLQREKKKAYQQAEKKGKDALAAYRKKAAETQREIIERNKEARRRGVESRERTAMRHKIQNVVGELNQLLLHEDKKRHVPDNLKRAVAAALDLVNMDTVGADERVAKYADLIAKETDPDKIAAYQMTMENIQSQGEKMGQRLKELRDAYAEIAESSDPDIANAHDPVIEGNIKELAGSIGDTSLRDMSIEQLEDVYSMYKMVLTRVRNANKSMLDEKREAISELASKVVDEVRKVGGEHTYRAAILDPARKFVWDNQKPIYAMEHIGSGTMTDAFMDLIDGEGSYARDIDHAANFADEQKKAHKYDTWDFKKKHTFESASGLKFDLTLEQILSLYAYSKRDQAAEHLRLGGFVFDSNIEVDAFTKDGKKLKKFDPRKLLNYVLKYRVNTADSHQITPDIMAEIIGTLSADQRSFVDAMQDYLSATMGAKGNEVTMKMYGVKLFKEKFYFPLKPAKQFLFEQNEVAGEVKIKNSGFTNKVVAKANNPVILSNFMDVWANHVHDMSMYHSFVLPLEDFNRIFNYNSPKQEGQPPVSVKGTIQNAYSPAAVNYVKQLITDLNGGARSDPRESTAKALMGRFKKAAVFASNSVVIQQPSALLRAQALVNPEYFGINPKLLQSKKLWNEAKQYAPVVVIKSMGSFDMGTGRGTVDYIKGDQTAMDKVDDFLSAAPAIADGWAWAQIWYAVKRETHAKNPSLKVGSEEFLQAAGKRFTEVIVKTQVYDSTLSRSANMRSKSMLMDMVTAFMAEPTTSINMLEDGLRAWKRGDKKTALWNFHGVYSSLLVNAVLVSIVYAMRDDDEDETFLEKMAGSFATELLDGANPLTYYPWVKDGWSLFQGYDVERSDMSLLNDLFDAVNTFASLIGTDTDGMDEEELADHQQKVKDCAWTMVDSVASVLGVPVKNIRRDLNSYINTYKTLTSGTHDNWDSVWREVVESAKNAIPILSWTEQGSKTDKLYDALISGDATYLERLKSGYEDDSAYHSAVRRALKENDDRIREAAIAWNADDLDAYMRLAKETMADGFAQDDVVAAITSLADELRPDDEESTTSKAKGLFTAEQFAAAISQGDQAMAKTIKTDIIQTAQKNGKTAEDAEKSFSSSAKSSMKKLFLDGDISESEAVNALVAYCGVEQEDAEKNVSEWAFENEYGFSYADKADAYRSGAITAYELRNILITVGGKTEEEADHQIEAYDWLNEVPNADPDSITAAAVRNYNEYCAADNVPKDVYLHIRSFSNNTKNDVDANGNTIYYSAMKKVMAEINAQAELTPAQKTAVARSLGWADKNIQKYRLW